MGAQGRREWVSGQNEEPQISSPCVSSQGGRAPGPVETMAGLSSSPADAGAGDFRAGCLHSRPWAGVLGLGRAPPVVRPFPTRGWQHASPSLCFVPSSGSELPGVPRGAQACDLGVPSSRE